MRGTSGKSIRIAVLSAIVVALLYALLFYQPPHGGLWTQVFFDSLHVPVFGLIALGIFLLWHPERSWIRRSAFALLVACALGLLSEFAQTFTSRDASVGDFVADCLGAAGTLAIAVSVFHGDRLSPTWRAASAVGGLLLLTWALAPLATISAAYAERNLQFPVILDPDSRFGRKLVRAQHIRYEIVDSSADNASHARITLLAAPWPGIAVHDLSPDWSQFSALVVDIAVEGDKPLAINLRVHDTAHKDSQVFSDRFNRALELGPGRHEIRIPLDELRNAPQNREMDLTEVAELIIFGSESDAGRTFRLYGIRLE
jgi:VanZ family protein